MREHRGERGGMDAIRAAVGRPQKAPDAFDCHGDGFVERATSGIPRHALKGEDFTVGIVVVVEIVATAGRPL